VNVHVGVTEAVNVGVKVLVGLGVIVSVDVCVSDGVKVMVSVAVNVDEGIGVSVLVALGVGVESNVSKTPLPNTIIMMNSDTSKAISSAEQPMQEDPLPVLGGSRRPKRPDFTQTNERSPIRCNPLMPKLINRSSRLRAAAFSR
jgi:hypothetical protein